MEIETLASFAVLALHRLNWDFPDLIFPMPKSRAIAQKFSQMLNVAMTTDIDAIEENQTLLVFNVSATLEESMLTIATLKICSPKRGYLFHLYEL